MQDILYRIVCCPLKMFLIYGRFVQRVCMFGPEFCVTKMWRRCADHNSLSPLRDRRPLALLCRLLVLISVCHVLHLIGLTSLAKGFQAAAAEEPVLIRLSLGSVIWNQACRVLVARGHDSVSLHYKKRSASCFAAFVSRGFCAICIHLSLCCKPQPTRCLQDSLHKQSMVVWQSIPSQGTQL